MLLPACLPPACLQVLRKFLEVFSQFNWEEYCLSVHGPIPISSFPHPCGAPSCRPADLRARGPASCTLHL